MKFIVKTITYQGGDFQYSNIEVEDSDIDEIDEDHQFWYDNKIYKEYDQKFLDFLIKVYNDLQLRQFGFTDCEYHTKSIIKDYSVHIINGDYYDTKYIIPFNNFM